MSKEEIDEAVAKATGEDVRTIAWLGFVLLDPMRDDLPDDFIANVNEADATGPIDEIDWDDIELERYLAMCG